jgi:hypothetical protein
VTEQIVLQHLETALLKLINFVEVHRLLLQFLLNLQPDCLVVHRIQQILIILNIPLV